MTLDVGRRCTMWPSAVVMPETEDELREVLGYDTLVSYPKGIHEVLASLNFAWVTAVSRSGRHDRGQNLDADPFLVIVVDAAHLSSPEASNLATVIATRAVGTRVVLAIIGDLARQPRALRANVQPFAALS